MNAVFLEGMEQQALTNIRGIKNLIANYIAELKDFSGTLSCIICIAAFTIDPSKRRDKKAPVHMHKIYEDDECADNASFLVQLAPWNRKFRTVPLQLIGARSGTASDVIREKFDAVLREISRADPRVRVEFVSIDGNEGYASHFEDCFVALKKCMNGGMFNSTSFRQLIDDLFREGILFWISNWLHLLKNARARLFTSRVCLNPLLATPGACMEGIMSYFETSTVFTDNSIFGKMKGSYLLNLFTLEQAFKIKDSGVSNDEFLYILVWTLWVNALENPNLQINTRRTILEGLLIFFSSRNI